MKTVADILAHNRSRLVTVTPDESVLEALTKMADANLGAVVVLEGRRLAGIFSERDFARKVTLHKKTPQTTPIKEVMTTEVFAVRAETSADECLSLMTRKGVRHLPVTRGDEVVGFVSILEVVGTVLAERETMISNLERYVSETWPL